MSNLVICTDCDGGGQQLMKSRDLHPAVNVYGWECVVLGREICYVRHCKACAGTGYRPAGTSGVPLVSPSPPDHTTS